MSRRNPVSQDGTEEATVITENDRVGIGVVDVGYRFFDSWDLRRVLRLGDGGTEEAVGKIGKARVGIGRVFQVGYGLLHF